MSSEFQVSGHNPDALFTLKVHRGDGMSLLAMNWKHGRPPNDFVGFAIEYQEPNGQKFFPLQNRLCFPDAGGGVNPNRLSTRFSPIQKFRWVHFPRNAELAGDFVYRVSPVFMTSTGVLSYGEMQEVKIQLRRETYPGQLNVCFTRGFVSSQAFVDKYVIPGFGVETLIPDDAEAGLTFVPTHPKAKEALAWMGFEARNAILEVLDQAIADPTAQVRVVAYDLNEPGLVSRLEQLGNRLEVIVDDSDKHGLATSGETQATTRLIASAGAANVMRQHMGGLQHNKTIVVDGANVQAVVCGSTNYSWRGFFVQANNAIVLRGPSPVSVFRAAFDAYRAHGDATAFGTTTSAAWNDLGLTGIDAKVGFSPHAKKNALLATIAADIAGQTTSSLFYSLAFLYQTPGAVLDAIKKVTLDPDLFVYGISDKRVGGLDIQLPDGKVAPMSPFALGKNVPEPFKSEPVGGSGARMHHKFVVIDFDKPTARVYMGSYNFSKSADVDNGENLLLIADRRIAVSYVVEALRIFDHYHFRVVQADAKKAKTTLSLQKPPSHAGEKPWFAKDYEDARRIKDRELFA
ncbi:MAG TPA: phospholipase D-like domain-containing protein [Gemmatimonadaceae bacterium]|nr:phospholipase D-like domain-containing protein [Gemmatimonadaceae bacterium]